MTWRFRKPKGIDKYGKFTVTGIIIGWLETNGGDDNIYESNVAVVQAEDGHTFLRWLGIEHVITDPVDARAAVVGTQITFVTTWAEQIEYTKVARGIE
jgi:hypothetical protein